MSILAEPRRRKQKISVDPQNIAWKSDNEKIGQKLLEKMGWTEGKGLGRNEQGTAENIRLKANYNAKGLGKESKNVDTVWMGHHDDFETLLANLNNKKLSTNKTIEIDRKAEEKDIPQSRIQMRYKKFTRGKDLASYSEKDKSAILGITKKKPKQLAMSENGLNTENTKNTIVSQISMSDYFASKMAALKSKNKERDTKSVLLDIEEESTQLNEPEVKKKKKSKHKHVAKDF